MLEQLTMVTSTDIESIVWREAVRTTNRSGPVLVQATRVDASQTRARRTTCRVTTFKNQQTKLAEIDLTYMERKIWDFFNFLPARNCASEPTMTMGGLF